jgi:hypothetical protein
MLLAYGAAVFTQCVRRDGWRKDEIGYSLVNNPKSSVIFGESFE